MVPSITTILHRFTGEWAALLQPEAILAVCGEIGSTGWRNRVLTPVTTVQVFLLQTANQTFSGNGYLHQKQESIRSYRCCRAAAHHRV